MNRMVPGLVTNDVTNVIYLLFKSINPDTSIGVSNLKYDIDTSTLAKFGNNAKDFLDDMYSNYPIIIDQG